MLDLWFSSHDGPVHVLIENQQAIFFIQQADSPQVIQLLACFMGITIKPLQLKDFDHQPVSGVYFNSQQVLYQARELLQQANIKHYEADIRPVERFLTERFLTGPVTIETADNHPPIRQEKHSFELLIINAKIKTHPCTERYKPQLKIMSLDIETDYNSQALYSISLLCQQWHITLMIDDKEEFKNTQEIEYFKHEKTLMLRFIDLLLDKDADIIIGWNIINFDFRFLQRKADSLKISLAIGRSESLPVWRKARTEQEHFFLLIPGRVVLDGIDTLKNATLNFPSFSLESVARELLGRGKLIDTKKNNDPLHKAKEIQRLFFADKQALAAYNLEDCQLVLDIFEQADLITFAIERARLTGLEMDRNGGSVAAFDNLYLPLLHRKGFVAPDINDRSETLSAPGGYVMSSKPGLYDSVLVLDYKSLYPSIIRTFCVDPYARIQAEKLDKKDCIAGFNGVSFSRNEFILPEIIQSLWQARDRAKQQKNKTLSQAIKIIMNSFYGVLGTSGCRVHDARLTSSITLRGHEIMKQSAALIEEEGYDVIYGDTDSIFVSLCDAKEQNIADKIGLQLVEKVNQYWQHQLVEKYQITSALEMEYETHFKRFFMPTIRGSDKGSKKRYAGILHKQAKDGKKNFEIIFKGLESIRSDWTQLSREVQKEIYQRIFNDVAYEEYLIEIVSNLRSGQYDEQLIYRKRLRQKLSDYKKNIPPHAQAAIKSEIYAKECGHPLERYQYGGWIEYVITYNGPEPIEYNKQALNYEHYIEKQIAPVVDAILMVKGTSLQKILNVQYDLF